MTVIHDRIINGVMGGNRLRIYEKGRMSPYPYKIWVYVEKGNTSGSIFNDK